MVRVGLTGGMGSGKSYVSALLFMRGIPVYDSDSNARRIMSTDKETIRALTDVVGENLYRDGILDRRLMAGYIFGDKEHARAVESVVHPKVREDFRIWTEHLNKDVRVCVLESAILFESGFDSEVDVTVAVYAPEELRIDRCVKRDGSDRESVLSRIRNQADQDWICSMSDYVIVNDGIAELNAQIDNIINKFNTDN